MKLWAVSFSVLVAVFVFQLVVFLQSPPAQTSCFFLFFCPLLPRPGVDPNSRLPDAGNGIRDAFGRQLETGMMYGGQFAAFHNGKPFVSLWGGSRSDYDNTKIEENTLLALFSSSKTVEPLLLARLHALGLLDLNSTISSVWPEFGLHGGKQNITFSEFLRHDAGLAWLEAPLELEETHNLSKISGRLSKTNRSPPNRRLYHGVLRGVFLGEVISRVTGGLTFHQALRKFDLLSDFQNDFFVGGEPAHARPRICPVVGFSLVKTICSFLFNVPAMDQISKNLFLQLFDKTSLVKRAVSGAVNLGDLALFEWTTSSTFNSDRFFNAQLSSASVFASAKAMAHLLSFVAQGGEGLWNAEMQSFLLDFSDSEAKKYDQVLGLNTTFTKGGFAAYTHETRVSDCRAIGATEESCFIDRLGEENTFYGWEGTGGSLAWFCPKLNLSVVYVSNTFHNLETHNVRARELVFETVRAVQKKNDGKQE